MHAACKGIIVNFLQLFFLISSFFVALPCGVLNARTASPTQRSGSAARKKVVPIVIAVVGGAIVLTAAAAFAADFAVHKINDTASAGISELGSYFDDVNSTFPEEEPNVDGCFATMLELVKAPGIASEPTWLQDEVEKVIALLQEQGLEALCSLQERMCSAIELRDCAERKQLVVEKSLRDRGVTPQHVIQLLTCVQADINKAFSAFKERATTLSDPEREAFEMLKKRALAVLRQTAAILQV